MASTLDGVLARSVRAYRERPALTFRSANVTYGQLAREVDRLALRLSDAVGAGDRVAVLAPNTPALVIGLFACWRLGAVAVPLSARWRAFELERTLQDAEPRALIAIATHARYSFADLIKGLLPHLPTLRRCIFVDARGAVVDEFEGSAPPAERLDPSLGLVLYTSGTTGVPRGALVPHRREGRGAEEMVGLLQLRPTDVGVFVVPITHAFGLTCALAMLAAGGRLVLVDTALSSEPVAEAIERRGATVLHGSPALFISLVKGSPSCLGGLRTGFVAGAPSPSWMLKELDRLGPRILNLYGMTEIGAACSVRPDDPASVRHTTVGRPIAGYRFRIDGPGGDGEIQVHGPSLGPGYHGQAAATAEAFRGGWFRTGDVGSMDVDGNVVISGRAKDMVNVAGFSVSPAEVEACLSGHPDVLRVAVVGVPDDRTGEALHAFVVPRPGCQVTPGELLRFARERIAAYKIPYRVVPTGELPILASGKPDRRRLMRLARQGAVA